MFALARRKLSTELKACTRSRLERGSRAGGPEPKPGRFLQVISVGISSAEPNNGNFFLNPFLRVDEVGRVFSVVIIGSAWPGLDSSCNAVWGT
jgi:hypothetical protein